MNCRMGISLLIWTVTSGSCATPEPDANATIEDASNTTIDRDTDAKADSGNTDPHTTSTETDSSPGATDSDSSAPPPPVCDNSGSCWDSCWGCAATHLCKSGQTACSADDGCRALQSCVAACPDDGWWDCYVTCGGDTNSRAEQLLQSFWDCIYCGACKNDCRNSGHDCSDVTGPGLDTDISDDGLTWHQANLTWYESYPDPGSDECVLYNGCLWSGYFYGLNEQMSESWVAANNIVAVHENHWNTYGHKTLRIRQVTTQGLRTIDATVYDLCSDDDCNGCCTQNMSETGFLIDMEMYTLNRLGGHHGIAEWTCLDC